MERNKSTAKKYFDKNICDYNIEITRLEKNDTAIIKVVLSGNDLRKIEILIDSTRLFYICGNNSYVFGKDLYTSAIDFFSGTDINPCYWAEKIYCTENVMEHNFNRFESEIYKFIETNYGNLDDYLKDDDNSDAYYSLLESFDETTGYSKEKLESFLLDNSVTDAFDEGLDDFVFTTDYLYCCYVINYICTKLSFEDFEEK